MAGIRRHQTTLHIAGHKVVLLPATEADLAKSERQALTQGQLLTRCATMPMLDAVHIGQFILYRKELWTVRSVRAAVGKK